MLACGVDRNQILQGDSDATHLAADLFEEDLIYCMDKIYKDLDANFKEYARTTQN